MNVSHSSYAKKGPKEDYNAYKEFSDIETDSLVTVAAMTHFETKKIDGKIIKISDAVFNKYYIN